jgi:hypothetical protein
MTETKKKKFISFSLNIHADPSCSYKENTHGKRGASTCIHQNLKKKKHAYINEQKHLITHYSFLLNEQSQDNIQERAYTIAMFSLTKNRTGI